MQKGAMVKMMFGMLFDAANGNLASDHIPNDILGADVRMDSQRLITILCPDGYVFNVSIEEANG